MLEQGSFAGIELQQIQEKIRSHGCPVCEKRKHAIPAPIQTGNQA
jgi:hypothetical protein